MWEKPVGNYEKHDCKKDVSLREVVSVDVYDPYGMDYDWGYNNIDGDDGKQVAIQKHEKDGDKKVTVYKEPEEEKNEDDEITFGYNSNSYSITARNFKLESGLIQKS